jgi:hypothetical protein
MFYWKPEIIMMFTSPQFAQSDSCTINNLNCSLCSYHQSVQIQIIVLLTHTTVHYVQINRVCRVRNVFYWHPELLIMFTSPQFTHSATCSFEIPKFSLCSYHHSLHSQLLVLLKPRNPQYVHITTVCTVRYLFYWHSELLIIFTSP